MHSAFTCSPKPCMLHAFSATYNLPLQSLLVECATIHFALFGGLHTLAAKENCNPTPPRVWCSLYVKSAAWVTASVDVKMFTLNSSSAESAAIRREGHCDLPNTARVIISQQICFWICMLMGHMSCISPCCCFFETLKHGTLKGSIESNVSLT